MTKRKNSKEEPLLTSSDNGDRIEATIPNKPGERVRVIKIPLSKKEKEVGAKAPRRDRVKMGGHAIDNILMSRKPEEAKQLRLWEQTAERLENLASQQLQGYSTGYELINSKGAGIQLSKGEYRLIIALFEILHERSPNNRDYKAQNYLGGNIKTDVAAMPTIEGGNAELKAPVFSTNLHELTKRYTGLERPGGKQQQDVNKMLRGLAEDPTKHCLLRWKRTTKINGGKKSQDITRTETIETFAPLIRIFTHTSKDETESGEVINEHKTIHIAMHPIFIDQAGSKYVALPEQLNAKLIEAYGGANISEVSQKLIFELFRALSNATRLNIEGEGLRAYTIGKQKLIEKIAPNYLPPNKKRPQLAEEYLQKGIETAKKMGILHAVEYTKGTTGEPLLKFILREQED